MPPVRPLGPKAAALDSASGQVPPSRRRVALLRWPCHPHERLSCLVVTGENHPEEVGGRASTAEVCVEILGVALVALVPVAVKLGAARCGASKGFFSQHLLEIVQM